MQVEVIGVLKSFLTFASSFQPHHAHNMLVFTFDLCFKNLQFIRDYVGLELVMQVVVDYDQEILMPLLSIVYHALTPNLIIVVISTLVELGVFKSFAFIEKTTMEFIIFKLLLLKGLHCQ